MGAKKGVDKRRKRARKLYENGLTIGETARVVGAGTTTLYRWKAAEGWSRGPVEPEELKLAESLEENQELNPRQRDFCLHYCEMFNATQAYYRVYGCSYRSAGNRGSKLLRNKAVQREIKRLRSLKNGMALVSREDVVEKLSQIAFANMGDFVEWRPEEEKLRLRDWNQLDGTLIGEVKETRDGLGVKLPDRLRALEILTRVLAIGSEQENEKTGELIFRVVGASREPEKE